MLQMELKCLNESVLDLPELNLGKGSILPCSREVPLVSVESGVAQASHVGAWLVGISQMRAEVKLFPPQY